MKRLLLIFSLLLMIAVLALISGPTQAAGLASELETISSGAELSYRGDADNALTRYADYLHRRDQRTFRNIERWRGSAADEAKSCQAAYESVFADGVMKITLAYGYHDGESGNYDPGHDRATFAALTRDCTSSAEAVCGFRVVSRSSNTATLVRDVDLAVAGRSRVRIQVRLGHGSRSSSDEDNLEGGVANSAQRAVTRQLEDLFFGGISGVKADGTATDQCEICGYYGHARDGGGPDFGPVPYAWRRSNGHPNYDLYRARKPGYRKLINSLEVARAANTSPKLVSVQACLSHSHFWAVKTCAQPGPGCKAESLSDFSSATGFILTRELSWPENFGANVGVLLDTVLGFKCRSAFNRNIGELKGLAGNKEFYSMYGSFL